jgi:hypothetical protein
MGTFKIPRDFPQVKVTIDSVEFGRVTSAEEVEGEAIDLCLPQPHDMNAWEEFEVVEQQPIGFKTITQASVPESVTHLRFSVDVFDPNDHAQLFALKNYTPHYVMCALLEDKTLMYLKRKERKYIKTGAPEYSFMWTFEFVECNDNN